MAAIAKRQVIYQRKFIDLPLGATFKYKSGSPSYVKLSWDGLICEKRRSSESKEHQQVFSALSDKKCSLEDLRVYVSAQKS